MSRKVTISLLLLIIVVGCTSEIKPDSPENTTMLLNVSPVHNDFDAFTNLFNEGRQEYLGKQKLKEQFEDLVQMNDRSSGSLSFRNFELLTFDTGEMVLVNLTPEIAGEVKVEDIVIVPDEMKNF